MKFSKNNPLAWLASLKLTVVLLAMAMYLIFVGTLAQVELGIGRSSKRTSARCS